MIEIVIERWSGQGGTTFRWSVWRNGARVGMGPEQPTADAAEAAASAFCALEIGARADRVTRL